MGQSNKIVEANVDRSYFDTTSRKTLLENKASEAESQRNILGDVPMTIFVG